jgi:hypothetical protein
MGFVEKVKQFFTGKTSTERAQESAALTEIRKKAFAAGLQEKQNQAIRLAKEREKVIYERKVKALRTPKPSFFAGIESGMSYGSPFGQPRFASSPIKRRKQPAIKYVYRNVQPHKPIAPKKFDVLGFG